ncbi:MAG: response regulator [Lachnospiraceae bacterium]|nr:response regulator [Lachnospiraceae bacterium]
MTLNLFSVGFLVATEPIILIVVIYLLAKQGETGRRYRLFRNFALFCLLACTTEIALATFVNLRFSMPAFFYQTLYSLNLCFGMMTLQLLYLYFTIDIEVPGTPKKIFRALRRLNLIIFAALIVANFFTGCIARYNSVGRLMRGAMFDIATYVLPLYFVAIIAVIAIIYHKQIDRRVVFSFLGVLGLTVLVLPLRQIYFPFMQLEYFALGLLVVIMLFLLETPAYRQLTLNRRQMEEARQATDAAMKEAMQASRAKSDFLSNMSHEIRTPMNAIIGMNDMILRETTSPAIRGYAEDIRGNGKYLLSVINDILDYSRIESGRMEIRKGPYRLSNLLSGLMEEYEEAAKNKGLDLLLDVDESLPDKLEGDETHLAQILKNLLENAIKYTQKGSVRLTVNGVRRGRVLTLFFKVADTGIGISKESHKEVFDSFSRVNMEKNRNILGTGLGLAITKELTEKMFGEIMLRSEEGKGSTFTVRLPQDILSDETIAQAKRKNRLSESTQVKSFLVRDADVLLVDDNRTNLRVTAMLLKTFGIEADTVSGGAECLIACGKKPYHIIFLDHRMPGMDGEETLRSLKRDENFTKAHTKVIALTASDDDDARERFLRMGFDEYLVKPVDMTRLKDVLLLFLPKEKIDAL